MLSEGATTDAVMHDEAWGSLPLKEAWRRTLFAGQVDAVTTEWRTWTCSGEPLRKCSTYTSRSWLIRVI